MPYTVKQVAQMSGISVRTLHFYDELGLLKPAFYGDNGYRFYEEAQLLTLQQILFYRELGFDLGQIKRTVGRADFEKAVALESHRELLRLKLARTRELIETVVRTIAHLKGEKKMDSEEMFAGFIVGADEDRFDERVSLGGELQDCKVSAHDTDGAMSVFEFAGTNSGPRHIHHNQDEWIYVLSGEFQIEVGNHKRSLCAGESIFLRRGISHAWASLGNSQGKIINAYHPAGNIEEFFREVGKFSLDAKIHEALSVEKLSRLFSEHGMDLVGPPLAGEWKSDDGRIIRTA